MAADRTVHAETGYAEVVRYDRSGKWYLEDKASTNGVKRRTLVTVGEAVTWVRDQPRGEVQVHWRKPGGSRFDQAIKRLILAGWDR